jgi:hypothetical protein
VGRHSFLVSWDEQETFIFMIEEDDCVEADQGLFLLLEYWQSAVLLELHGTRPRVTSTLMEMDKRISMRDFNSGSGSAAI